MQLQINKENFLEIALILTFVAMMLWIGLADSWGHRITHDFPTSYLASDPFQHQTRAQWIKDAGNYKYEAPYYSAGLTDVVGFYPPILHHITVLFSQVSGLEVYDVMLFLTVLFAVFGALIFYLIIRQWNKQIAMLSFPLMTYMFTIREARVAFYWGHWPALLGDFFLIATCWMLANMQKKHSAFFIGLFLAGTAMGHTAATIFAVLFIMIFFAVGFLLKQFNKTHLKTMFVAVMFFVLFAGYFLILFKQTWMVVHGLEFGVILDWSSGGGFVKLEDFGFVPVVMIAFGLVFLLASKNDNMLHKLLGVFAVVAGFTNYVGFAIRAFNFRFYWPITLSILFGTALYAVLRVVVKNLTVVKTVLIVFILLFLTVYNNYAFTGKIDGLMNKYTWQTLNWVKDNTEKDAKIFYFYGDAYDQDASLGNSGRRNTRLEINDMIQVLQNKTLHKITNTKELMESGTQLPYKKGFLNYGLKIREDGNITGRKQRNICDFDYYVFDGFGRIPVLVQFNQIIANTLVQQNFTLAYRNDLTVILKNPQPGGNCFGPNNKINF